MRKRISLVLAAVLACLCCAMPASAYSAAIEVVGGNRYQSIRLTPEVYNHANSDLSDLRILDSAGEAVPYFVNSGVQTVTKGEEIYPLMLVDAYAKGDAFYFDYALADAGGNGEDTVATALVFTTRNRGFAKRVAVYGGYDGEHWTFVQDDMLYVVDDVEKMDIVFPQQQKYTNYRLVMTNNLEAIAFDAVALVRSMMEVDSGLFMESLMPVFSVEESGTETLIKLEGLRNLRLCDITLETDSMFKRTVHVPYAGDKVLYNLELNGVAYTDTTLPMSLWQTVREETMVLTVENHDDKPIKVTGVAVRYYADEVVFEGRPGEAYTLQYGADETKKAPVYDIAAYKDEILKSDIGEAVIGVVVENEKRVKEVPPAHDYSGVFNAVIIGVAVLLGGVILLRLYKKN